MAILPQSRAVVLVQSPGVVKVAVMPTPQPSPTQILIGCSFVGLNPSDTKMVEAGMPLDSVAGLDFAGVVVSKGANRHTSVKVGDRVCGVALGYNREDSSTGAFAEYIVAEEHLVLPIPGNMSFEEAATLPVALLTAGMVMYKTLALKCQPLCDSRHFLVYGGSTTSGIIMIQLLRHSGFRPIAVCSPRNFDLVRAAGAAAVYDYRSTTCAADILSLTKNKLVYAVDCITNSESMKICYGALGSKGGRYVALDSFLISGHSRRAVRPSWVFAMSAFGCAVDWVAPYKCGPSLADRDFAENWFREATLLVHDGIVRPHRYRVVGDSLQSVGEGLKELHRGQVSGVKLVCAVGNTTRCH
ncbi:hypothetical protein QQS21_006229 [Conoideocrella luteorostrata]|uniref:Enoyl reductase (ER) domain-containing protein n=1 Tax=Conoideocrella luteorostrata TaxID=1105319 RepID=A0AAJ0FYG4_9HYPO|nr:hypothetical protein QQS21_006229 [Conoideocrella luteorostrata]